MKSHELEPSFDLDLDDYIPVCAPNSDPECTFYISYEYAHCKRLTAWRMDIYINGRYEFALLMGNKYGYKYG